MPACFCSAPEEDQAVEPVRLPICSCVEKRALALRRRERREAERKVERGKTYDGGALGERGVTRDEAWFLLV